MSGRALARALAAILAAALAVAGCEEPSSGAPPPWHQATRASCWDGPHAEVRMMNILSPLMPEATFRARVRWMRERGCNAAHVLLVNRENGDHAGYSPWGVGVGPGAAPCDECTAALMRRRIRHLRGSGLAVVVWIMADDSSPWARVLARDAEGCLARIAEAGLLADASTVVAGLEMDEYWGLAEARAVVAGIRGVYAGAVGAHHTSGRAPFAALADILFYQVEPGRSAGQIAADAAAALRLGRPVNFFELDRRPNRALAEAALAAGCFGVGNW